MASLEYDKSENKIAGHFLTPRSSRSKAKAASPSSGNTSFMFIRIGLSLIKLFVGQYFLAYTDTITKSGVWCQSHRHFTVPAGAPYNENNIHFKTNGGKIRNLKSLESTR